MTGWNRWRITETIEQIVDSVINLWSGDERYNAIVNGVRETRETLWILRPIVMMMDSGAVVPQTSRLVCVVWWLTQLDIMRYQSFKLREGYHYSKSFYQLTVRDNYTLFDSGYLTRRLVVAKMLSSVRWLELVVSWSLHREGKWSISWRTSSTVVTLENWKHPKLVTLIIESKSVDYRDKARWLSVWKWLSVRVV